MVKQIVNGCGNKGVKRALHHVFSLTYIFRAIFAVIKFLPMNYCFVSEGTESETDFNLKLFYSNPFGAQTTLN